MSDQCAGSVPGPGTESNSVSSPGTYALWELSCIHPASTFIHSFVQQIFLQSPGAGLYQYLHDGVK